ncbi:extracellular solute-binding protein [Nocardia sp. NBC_01503]|uniref:ABC transporter substrate-binding protein n=1 Tax=Nocardia sp. NBC_01503 TaxID=2975997 RepID=UPI002E7AEE74|nr:extracellular solute-binding protein [Nocardia sp. NBC_01503]WTL29689.1 extracellular solute-binding protein [Nocardia sp. NBC_01503]
MNKSPDSLPPELRSMLSARPSRRGLLRAGGLIAAAGTLAACGTKGSSSKGGAPACTPPTDDSATEKTLNFSNWPGYLDEAADNAEVHPTMAEFTAKSGIKVSYVADVNDNNEFWGKVSAQLTNCQSISRDIMVLSDSTAVRVVRQGYTQKLDVAKMPNFVKNLHPMLRGADIDPQNNQMAPWQSGLVGIGVNTNVAKEVRTIDELLTRPDLKGKVVCLTEMPDTMGLMLHSIGKSAAKFTDDDYDNALAKLQKAVQSGHVRKFTGNDYVQDLAKGDIAACMAWSGDVIQLSAQDPKIKFISPDEGPMLYSDEALIPVTSPHAANAMALLDWYYDPAIAARLSAFVNYVCPVAGAQEEMAKFNPELAQNELIFPSPEMQKTLQIFMSLTEAKEKDYQSKFQALTGA